MTAPPPPSGHSFLQVPGPTPIPERILAAMNWQMPDHRSPQFREVALRVLSDVRSVCKTRGPVILFPSSDTGGWEAAFVNTLSPRDPVLFVGSGQFSYLCSAMAGQLGLAVTLIKTDWRTGGDPSRIEECLRADVGHVIKAVCIVHNETSIGARIWIEDVRDAIDSARHPALLLVDAVSSLTRQNRRRLVAHFRTFSGLFSDGQQRAGNHATGWLRASDSNFDAHHDARVMVKRSGGL